MELNITSKWATMIFSKLLTKIAKSKTGEDITIQLNGIILKGEEGDKITLHADADVSITKQYLQSLLLRN